MSQRTFLVALLQIRELFSVPKNVPRGFAPNQRTVLISSLKSNFIRLHSLIIANPMRHDDNYYKHDGTHRKLDKLRVYVISVRFNICRIHGVLIFSNHP